MVDYYGGETADKPKIVEAKDVKTKGFNLPYLEGKLKEMNENPDSIKSDTFCDFLDEVIKLLSLFGSAMSMAFSGKLRAIEFIRCPGEK